MQGSVFTGLKGKGLCEDMKRATSPKPPAPTPATPVGQAPAPEPVTRPTQPA